MKTVIIATKNKGKVAEFKSFFNAHGIAVKSLLDIDESIDIVEDGDTFEENALIKARFLAHYLSEDVVADDSGLEVSHLNGEPGIYSARYSGLEKDDHANNQKLLSKLEGVPIEKRQAQFVCALAYVTNSGEEYVVRGTCEGVIGFSESGENGFGYDPLFYVPSLNKSFAELTKPEKQAISHRGNAIRKLQVTLFGESNG